MPLRKKIYFSKRLKTEHRKFGNKYIQQLRMSGKTGWGPYSSFSEKPL